MKISKTLQLKLCCCLFLISLVSSVVARLPTISDIKSDETVVFFNTSAWFDKQKSQWHVPIHGWIYEPENSTFRLQMIEKSLKTTFGLAPQPETENNFKERVNLLLADNESGKTLVIKISDHSYVLNASLANGHFKQELTIDDAVIKAALKKLTPNLEPADLVTKKLTANNFSDPNRADSAEAISEVTSNKSEKATVILKFQVLMPADDSRTFQGQVKLVHPEGISIISDIDDTVKISQVTERKALLNNTFFQNFKAVPGMVAYYKKWLSDSGSLHYVSSSPWQLYPGLLSFLNAEGFPEADFALKNFRFKDSTLMNLFKKSSETKPPQIEKILTTYPQRRFILVGDSGELDPEIYAKIQQKYKNQIIQILIRNVTGESLDNPRFMKLYTEAPPGLWQLFDDAETISDSFIDTLVNNNLVKNKGTEPELIKPELRQEAEKKD